MWPQVSNAKLTDAPPKSARVVWLSACVLILVWWVAAFSLSSELPAALRAESAFYVYIGMMLLSFPAGLIWALVLAFLNWFLEMLNLTMPTLPWIEVVVYWGGATALGYAQWFKLIPWIRARRRAQ